MPDSSYNTFLETIMNRYNGGFQPYAAGDKRYGASGRDAPNIGPTANRQGYAERDLVAKARRNYMLRQMQNRQRGNFMDPSVLRGLGR